MGGEEHLQACLLGHVGPTIPDPLDTEYVQYWEVEIVVETGFGVT